ncbi:hypothetical protein [Fervidobacterium pennivorans]|uniref:hypothetical protein n=1 Tax=Fervidobacterium pennivorans TaxID=93466 RepID=UPI00201B603B|nr:hypothetical protein [Fervidobacterium pennivorans]
MVRAIERASILSVLVFLSPTGRDLLTRQRIEHDTREIIEREERKKVKMVTASRLHSDKDRRLRETESF